jgi:hypothetical protein
MFVSGPGHSSPNSGLGVGWRIASLSVSGIGAFEHCISVRMLFEYEAALNWALDGLAFAGR